MIQLGDHFSSDNRNRHSDWLRQQRWFIKARQEHHRQEEIADKLDEDVLSFATEAVIATQIQIMEFEARIDAYEARIDAYDAKLDSQDIAITKALIENQELLDTLFGYRQELLEKAYVLDDGRRVFKSEDGNLVKDEFGEIVDQEEIDPNQIPNHHPTLETFFNNEDTIFGAKQQRQGLHEAQDKIDAARERISVARDKIHDARERIAEGDLTVDELENLDAELLDAMPPSTLPTLPASAMKHLSDIDTTNNAPNAKTAFSANANPASIAPAAAPEQAPVFDPMG